MSRDVITDTVTNLNEIIPELVDLNIRDLKFLLVVGAFCNALQRDSDEAADLLRVAWSLDISRSNSELSEEEFISDIVEGVKFIQGDKFERFYASFSRYIDSD
jgi:hypothetical protein